MQFPRVQLPAVAILFVVLTSSGLAAVGRWSTSGPPAGTFVTSLLTDPFTPGTIFAGTVLGFFRSRDRGETWTLTKPGSTRSAVALQGSPLFLGTSDGLFRSDDGGDEWIDISAGLSSRDVRSVAFSGILVVATATGVFRSRDQGNTWTFVYASNSALEVAVESGAPQTIYAALGAQGLAKSVDAGDHWSIVLTGPQLEVGHVAAGREMVLAGDLPDGFGFGSLGLYVSRDGGMTWSHSADGPSAVSGVAVDPFDPLHGYAMGRLILGIPVDRTGALFETRDAGSSWQKLGLEGFSVTAIATDNSDPDPLYAGTDFGIWKRRTARGSEWRQVNEGISRSRVTSLGVSSSIPPVIYAGTNNGVFRKGPTASRWASADLFTDSVPVRLGFPLFSSLAVEPGDPNVCYVGARGFENQRPGVFGSGGLSKTRDGGFSWTSMRSGSFSVLVLDPTSHATLYAATGFPSSALCCGQGVLKSLDGGKTWFTANAGIPLITSSFMPPTYPNISSFVIDPATPSVLYLATFGMGLFKSTDGAQSWVSLPRPEGAFSSIAVLAISRGSPSILYGASSDNLGALFRSRDRGSSWERLGALPAVRILDLVVDPETSDVLYAATDSAGIFRSGDGGMTWTAFNEGLGDLHVAALAISQAAPRTLYAGTADGVYEITIPFRASPPHPPPRVVTRGR